MLLFQKSNSLRAWRHYGGHPAKARSFWLLRDFR